MSTRTTTQSKSPKQDASQSALHYLFQEVSKLASPIHSSFMETDSPWTGRKEEVASCLCPSAHEKVPHRPLTSLGKNVHSPLKVLSLINLQCERLQHPVEDDESGHNSHLFISDFGFSKPAEAFQDSAQPLIYENNSVRKYNSEFKKDSSSEDGETKKSSMVFPVQAEVVDTPQTPELQFSVGLDLSSDWTKECLSTQYTFYDFLPEAAPAKALCSDEQMTFQNDKCARETLLPLDHNANICLNADEPRGLLESVDTQFYDQPCSSLEQQPPNTEVNTVSMCEDSSEDIPKQNKNSELTSAERDNSALCAEQCALWRSKRRKQPRPSRSASVQDPDFQGVTFRMDTELDETKEQCRLLITSKYSMDLPVKSLKRTRLRTRRSQKSLKTSSDEDSDLATSETKDKVCASCCTKKTPMWRDAEDGTPLCNACGIRYKKYRVRCINCWNIPKKDGNSVSRCSKCGHFVRLTLAQRRPTI